MSEWLSYVAPAGLALRSVIESIPVWVWFGVVGLFVIARVGAKISREVANLGRSLENLEVQAGEIQEHIRLIGRALRLRPDHSGVARED